MLTKWFGTRSSRSSQRDFLFRPELEYLEGRLAPSSLAPMDPGNGHGHGHGDGNGHGNSNNFAGGGSIVGPSVNQSGNVHNNIHITDSFNNNTGSFNNVLSVAGSGLLGPGQMSAIGTMFALSSVLAAQSGNSNVGTLINDEIALAVDNYLLMPANAGALSASGSASLTADVNALNSAIGTLESGLPFLGPAIGGLTYDVAFSALTAAQPHI